MPSTAAPSAEPEFYTPRQAAQKLGHKGPRKVYELMSSGRLASVTIRSVLRIPAPALAAYMESLPRPEDLCTIPEAARRLQVSWHTVDEMIRDGDITAVRVEGKKGRQVLRKSLDGYLAAAARS